MAKVKRNLKLKYGVGSLHKSAFEEHSLIKSLASFQTPIESAVDVQKTFSIPDEFSDSSVLLVEYRNVNGIWLRTNTAVSVYVISNKIHITLLEGGLRWHHFRFTLLVPKFRKYI